MTKRIRERSSALDGALTRSFRDVSAESFADVFEFALENGGEDEVGFPRAEGVSFNPKCARVVLILLGDLLVAEKQLVRVAMLAAANPESWGKEGERELALRAQKAFRSTDRFVHEESQGVKVVAIALFLDLLRHTHQIQYSVAGSDASTLLAHAVADASVYEEWAEEHCPDVAKKIRMWRERNER